ncbi:MAG: hypothetical protein ACTSPB_01020 [Candidatus Thorarchaeota archaeon]
MTGNQEAIEQKFDKDKESELLAARHAWRSLLVPAVGSAAFFASTVVGFIRTYRKYGFPQDAFKSFDYALMGIPFAIVGMAFLYQAEEVKQEDGNAEV